MPRKPALDPVTRYATDVVAGAIIAGRLVRLACQRHLKDLDQAKAKGLVWKPDQAQEAIDFFPTVLCLPEETEVDDEAAEDAEEAARPETGTPFLLTPFQQFIVGSLFGWFAVRVSKAGVRRERQRFRICYFEGGKGCGKTPMGAGILIFMLVRHGVRGAQLFCAAVTKDQAKLAFADCVKMVAASPALRELITSQGNNLSIKKTGSFIRPISAEKRGLDGKRVRGAVVDELHEHPSATVVVKLIAGIKGQPNALIFMPTNSGFDQESACWYYHEYSREILEGKVVNETWFAFVCHLDPCDRCYAEGKRQPSDDCPDCDDWKVEGPHWLKAVPNLGVSVTWQYQREQVRLGIDLPSQRNWVRRLNFCQWTNQATVWITTEAWARCATSTSPEIFHASLLGRECFLGIDLSDKIDLSAVVCVFPRPLQLGDGSDAGAPAAAASAALSRDTLGNTALEEYTYASSSAGVSEDDLKAGAEAILTLDRPTIDCAIDVLPFFWMPEKTLHRRAQEDGIPYPDWARDKFIMTTPGSLIDHDAIVEFIIGTLAVRYQIRGVGIDQAGAAGVVSKLQRHFGEELVKEIPQGFRRLSEPSKLTEALVVSRNVTHDANPCMANNVGNMGKEENAWREIRPVKLSQRKRIDGGVALIDGLAQMTATPAAEESVYNSRGVRSLGDYRDSSTS
jgi:phage terminase large subunit-like protein